MSEIENAAHSDARFRMFLIRHGESWEDVDKRIYDRMEESVIPLTEKGKQQARSLGDVLAQRKLSNGARIFISPGTRTTQTFAIMASRWRNIEYRAQEEKSIRKQSWGTFPPHSRASIEEERYRVGVFFYKFPNGESGENVYNRISRFVNRLEAQFRSGQLLSDVVVVTHGLELRLLLMRLFRWSIEEFEGLAGPPNGVCVTVMHTGQIDYIMEEPYPAYQGRISRQGRVPHPLDGVSRIR